MTPYSPYNVSHFRSSNSINSSRFAHECCLQSPITHTHTHIHAFNGPFPGLSGSAGTRKVKPIWILPKQETVSGCGISQAVCKSAPCSRQKTMPAPHHLDFYRPDALPALNQQSQSIEGNHRSHSTFVTARFTSMHSIHLAKNYLELLESKGRMAHCRCRLNVSESDKTMQLFASTNTS